MSKQILAVSYSLLAGLLLAIIIQMNAALGKEIGVLESAFIVHLVGSILSVIIISNGIYDNVIKKIRTTPKHLFMGGVLGIFIVVAGNVTVPTLGILVALSLFICFDLLSSTIVDHAGLFGLPRFPINTRRVFGLLLASTGVVLIVWG